MLELEQCFSNCRPSRFPDAAFFRGVNLILTLIKLDKRRSGKLSQQCIVTRKGSRLERNWESAAGPRTPPPDRPSALRGVRAEKFGGATALGACLLPQPSRSVTFATTVRLAPRPSLSHGPKTQQSKRRPAQLRARASLQGPAPPFRALGPQSWSPLTGRTHKRKLIFYPQRGEKGRLTPPRSGFGAYAGTERKRTVLRPPTVETQAADASNQGRAGMSWCKRLRPPRPLPPPKRAQMRNQQNLAREGFSLPRPSPAETRRAPFHPALSYSSPNHQPSGGLTSPRGVVVLRS